MKRKLSLLEAIRSGQKIEDDEGLAPPPNAARPLAPAKFMEKYPQIAAGDLQRLRDASRFESIPRVPRDIIPSDIDPEEFAQDFSSLYQDSNFQGFEFYDEQPISTPEGIKKAREANYQRALPQEEDPFGWTESDPYDVEQEESPENVSAEELENQARWHQTGAQRGIDYATYQPVSAVDAIDNAPAPSRNNPAGVYLPPRAPAPQSHQTRQLTQTMPSLQNIAQGTKPQKPSAKRKKDN